MKLHRIAIAASAALLTVATPAAAQIGPSNFGTDFIDAVRKSDGGKVAELLTNPAGDLVNTKANDGDSALMIAIRRRDEDFTAFLLNKGADPNLAGKGGDIPLVAAARLGFDTAVDWLLGVGAKVDGTNRAGETALIIAVQQHDASLVRALLAAGANPDKTDNAQGYSARDYATRDTRGREILKIITDKKPKA